MMTFPGQILCRMLCHNLGMFWQQRRLGTETKVSIEVSHAIQWWMKRSVCETKSQTAICFSLQRLHLASFCVWSKIWFTFVLSAPITAPVFYSIVTTDNRVPFLVRVRWRGTTTSANTKMFSYAPSILISMWQHITDAPKPCWILSKTCCLHLQIWRCGRWWEYSVYATVSLDSCSTPNWKERRVSSAVSPAHRACLANKALAGPRERMGMWVSQEEMAEMAGRVKRERRETQVYYET